MNRNQFNRTGMFSTVKSYMESNQSIWSGVKAINESVSALAAGIALIDEKARKQQTTTLGTTEEKATVRLELEEKVLEIADQLSALAVVNKDSKLGAQVELSLSKLDRLPDDTLGEIAKTISGLATENSKQLSDYGIAAADIKTLVNFTAKFQAVKSSPRMAVAARVSETATLPEMIGSVTSLLRSQLDKQLTKFRKSNPEFYAGYHAARMVMDRGGNSGARRTASARVQPPPAPAQ